MAATPTFRGFGPGLYAFFEGIADNNDRAWFAAHKADYETQVREPLEALFDELEPTFGSAKLFRINRDVRFSKDKSPYKTEQAGIIHTEGGGALYVQVSADGATIGGGVPFMDSARLARYRQAVDGEAGDELAGIIATLRRTGFDVGTLTPDGISEVGDLKRVPKPYDPDHPRGDLLKMKSLIAVEFFLRPTWLESRAAVKQISKRWSATAPLLEWLAAHVGPSSGPHR